MICGKGSGIETPRQVKWSQVESSLRLRPRKASDATRHDAMEAAEAGGRKDWLNQT